MSTSNASTASSSSSTTAGSDTMKDTGDGNTTQPICKASECPLNQNNIPHTLGLYRDPVEAPMAPSFTFGGSNPPPFIWDAYKRFKISLDLEELARKRGWVRKANDIKKSGQEQGGVVSRFLDRHCGCSQSGKEGHGHPLCFIVRTAKQEKMMAGIFGNL